MRRRPRASRPPPLRPDDRALERHIDALRTDYLRIAPDPTFVARVHGRLTALTRPLRIRRRRRALGFAASVLVAFLAGFLGAGGGRSWGRGGASSADPALLLSSGGGALTPLALPAPVAAARVPDPRTTADRLRALLTPLCSPATAEPATIAAWKKATRDPDPTLRAVARALLRAHGTPLDAGPRAPPATTLVDLDAPDDLSGGDGGVVPESGNDAGTSAPPSPDDVPGGPPRGPPRRASSAREPPLPRETPR